MAGKKARKQKKKSKGARDANVGEAIPGLPNHLVASHILRSEFFVDTADLARLLPVSRAMRATVKAAGRRLEEMDVWDATKAGCLSAVQRLQRRGLLSPNPQDFLCAAAAWGGHLEELKLLRENNSPCDEGTCAAAAAGGHINVLQ